MSKKRYQHCDRQVATPDNAQARELTHSLEEDDNSLPNPEDLQRYKDIDEGLVKFFMEASLKEQEHRHRMNGDAIELARADLKSIHKTNNRGLFFAFLSVLVCMGVSAYALYLDRNWFAGLSLVSGLVAIVSVFVGYGKVRKSEEPTKH